MASGDFDALFGNLRRGPWHDDPNSVIQEAGARNGNIESQGWLADNSVSADVIQADAVTANKIAAGAITAGKIAADSITATEIAAGAIETDHLAANAVTAAKIAANTITASEIAANAITADEIQAQAVTALKIAGDAVTANKIAANAVETNHILAANVTSGKIVATITGKKYGGDNGTTSNPGFFFDSDADSGLIGGGGQVQVVCNGNEVFNFAGGANENFSANILSPDTDNTYSLGRSAFRWTEVWAVDGSINTSDARLKKDVEDVPLGLDFVRTLRPVAYRWRDTVDTQAGEQARSEFDAEALTRRLAPIRKRIKQAQVERDLYAPTHPRAIELAEQIEADYDELHAKRDAVLVPIREAQRKRRPGKRMHMGLLAQDVKAALDAVGIDAAAWKVAPDGTQSLSYSELIAPLIKSVQELAGQVEALQRQVADLGN